MLQLILNNTKLRFTGKIRFRNQSPLLYDIATYTNEFTLPFCPETDEALGFIRYLETSSVSFQYKNVVFASNKRNIYGTLTINSIDNGYKAYWVSNSKRDELYKYNLKSISKTYLTDVSGSYDGSKEFVFCPVYMPYIESKIINPEYFVQKHHLTHVNIFNTGQTSFVETDNIKGVEPFAVPFFFLRQIIEDIFYVFNINCVLNALKSDNDFKQLLLFNNVAINNIGVDFNKYTTAGYIVSILNGPTTQLTLNDTYVTLNVGDYVHLEYVGNPGFKNVGDAKFKIISINGLKITISLDSSTFEPYTFTDDVYVHNYILLILRQITVTHNTTININKHLPEVTFGTFQKEIEKLLFVKFIFSDTNNSCKIVKLNDVIISGASTNITKYRTGSAPFSRTRYEGYEYGFSDNDKLTNERFDTNAETNNYYKKTVGTPDLSIVSAASPMCPIADNIYTKVGAGCNVAVYNPYDSSIKNNAIKLFFYRGQSITNGINYPLGTIDEKNKSGVKLENANLSLLLDSEYSVLEKNGKYWVDWFINRKKDVEEVIIWPEELIAEFDWCMKYEINYINHLVAAFEYESDEQENIEWGVTELAKC